MSSSACSVTVHLSPIGLTIFFIFFNSFFTFLGLIEHSSRVICTYGTACESLLNSKV